MESGTNLEEIRREIGTDAAPADRPAAQPMAVTQAAEVDPEQVSAEPEIVSNLTGFSPTFGRLAAAMAKAQTSMKQPEKTKTAVIKFKKRDGTEGAPKKYKYCDIADILKVALPALGPQGIAFFQFPTKPYTKKFIVYNDANQEIEIVRLVAGVQTRLVHGSGEWVENNIEATCDGMAPQTLASAITYLRRIGGQMLLGIAGDSDDDGEDAQGDQEGGASGVEGRSVPAPVAGNGNRQDGDIVHRGQVEDARIEKVGQNKLDKYVVKITGFGWAGTLNDKMGKAITRENGTGMMFDFKIRRQGSHVDLLGFEPVLNA